MRTPSRSPLAFAALVAAALVVSGCSAIWKPVVDDAGLDGAIDGGVDGGLDGDVDGGTDGGEPEDGGMPPDAWVPPPPEVCTNHEDDDRDGLTDCDDPECYGHVACCDDRTGRDLLSGGFSAGAIPPDWERSPGTVLRADGDGESTVLDFGAGGWVRRSLCAPLATGFSLDLALETQRQMGRFAVLLTPAAAPGSSGFLDELAVRFDELDDVSITRAGERVPLEPPPAACSTVRHTATSYRLPAPVRLVVHGSPMVSRGVPVLRIGVEIHGAFGGSCTELALVRDLEIELRDLVRTEEPGGDTCSGTPGLYTVIEGRGGVFSVGPTSALRRFQCVSPSTFSDDGGLATLTASDLATAAPAFAAGGIGSPALASGNDSYGFRLLYDGALEDRSSEIFHPLTMRVGLSTSTYLSNWVSRPTPAGDPIGGPDMEDAREPSGSFVGADIIAYARRGASGYDLWRAGTTGGVGSTIESPQRLLEASDETCSYREPAIVRTGADDLWVFVRCDHGDRSTLALVFDPEGSSTAPSLRSTNLLAGRSAIADRVRAVDVLSQLSSSGRYFAVWVLADGTLGGRELHLFVGQAAEGRAPVLEPYEGNPVLRSQDFEDGCRGESCSITSFAVALDRPSLGLPRLVFYVARTRLASTGPVYEFVPRTQTAPRALVAR